MNNENHENPTIKEYIEARETLLHEICYEEGEYLIEAYRIAINALNKQIPQRPLIRSWSPAYCPSCGTSLSESKGDGYYKHCYSTRVCDCGQQLEWGE